MCMNNKKHEKIKTIESEVRAETTPNTKNKDTNKNLKKVFNKKKILITSALPYVNNIPHLGNLICIISADVFSRFLKIKGFDVINVLGTDEHGTTTELKALQENKTPEQVSDHYFKIHTKIYKWFDCLPDCYGRTSSKKNHEITKDIFLKLYKNGYILEDELEQPYCKHCDIVLSDRFVIGTCPYCGYENARGDQCDNCGKLLNPKDLINPKCVVCHKEPIFKKFKHLFLDLKKLQPLIQEWFEKKSSLWTSNAVSTTRAWLKEGLKPRCITRNLKYGVKVPLKGFEELVFYSWFDAPIGYISIVADSREDWKQWWYNPKDVLLVQFMGKDNIPFHTVMFPGMLLGTKDNYTTLDIISANEYLNYEDKKFSKSLGIGLFGDDIIELNIKADAWRFYLMANRPERSDTNFTWQDFQHRINNELIANFSNLVFRVTKFLQTYLEGRTSKDMTLIKETEKNDRELEYSLDYHNELILFEKSMFNIEFRKAINIALQISSKGNKFFQDQKPWVLIKQDKEKTRWIITKLVTLVKDLSILFYPFIPKTCKAIWEQLGIDTQSWSDLHKPLLNHRIKNPELLFNKIEDVESLRKRFSGHQTNKDQTTKETKSKKQRFELPDFRVAKIIKVRPHPNADKLLLLNIDLGFEKRQLVAGLKNYYKPEELLNKNIIIVANLKPAVIRGELSNGMLLAALDNINKDVGLLLAPNANPGDIAFPERIGLDDIKTSTESKKKTITIQELRNLNLIAKKGSALINNQRLKTKSDYIIIDKNIEGPIF